MLTWRPKMFFFQQPSPVMSQVHMHSFVHVSVMQCARNISLPTHSANDRGCVKFRSPIFLNPQMKYWNPMMVVDGILFPFIILLVESSNKTYFILKGGRHRCLTIDTENNYLSFSSKMQLSFTFLVRHCVLFSWMIQDALFLSIHLLRTSNWSRPWTSWCYPLSSRVCG